MPAPPNTYAARNELLLAMGYASYDAYLNSALWKTIRAAALRKYGKHCGVCGRPTHLIHHKGYGRDTLEGRTLDHLIPLCDPCHKRVEFKQSGKKRTIPEANLVLVRMLRCVRKAKPRVASAGPGRSCMCGKLSQKYQKVCKKCRRNKPWDSVSIG